VGDERDPAPGGSGKYVDVYDPVSQRVIASFHDHEGIWNEEVSGPAPVSVTVKKLSLVKARAAGKTLLGQRGQIIADAENYSRRAKRPVELEDILKQHALKFDAAAAALKDASTDAVADDQSLIAQLGADAKAFRAKGQQIRIDAYKKSQSPTGEQLLYLREHQQVGLVRIGVRTPVEGTVGDFLEIYNILEPDGKPLWVAHFHYPTATIARTEFDKAHLKLYSQRNLGRKFQLQQAKSNQKIIDIFRGDMSKALAKQIFPLLDPVERV
jgi:hypothetical protein